MRNDPFSRSPQRPQRRGLFGNIRWWVLLLAAGYAAFYWFSNRTVDPYTGEKVMIDSSLDARQEAALGLQAYQQILSQERPLDPNAPVSRDVRDIAERLIAKVDVVETALAQEHGVQPAHFSRDFQWEVNVIPSEQANAFCLPGGKMAVYTGLVPVARTRDAMAVVMGHEIAHALLRHGAQRMAQQKLTQIGQVGMRLSRRISHRVLSTSSVRSIANAALATSSSIAISHSARLGRVAQRQVTSSTIMSQRTAGCLDIDSIRPNCNRGRVQ